MHHQVLNFNSYFPEFLCVRHHKPVQATKALTGLLQQPLASIPVPSNLPHPLSISASDHVKVNSNQGSPSPNKPPDTFPLVSRKISKCLAACPYLFLWPHLPPNCLSTWHGISFTAHRLNPSAEMNVLPLHLFTELTLVSPWISVQTSSLKEMYQCRKVKSLYHKAFCSSCLTLEFLVTVTKICLPY